MHAATVSRFGGPEVIEISEHSLPDPGPGQVRVRVTAAALNPVDLAMRAGVFGGPGRVGLGWDLAGVVDAVGADSDWTVGERVFAVVTGHHKQLGTHAEYIVVDASILAPSPTTLDDVHASTLPLNATTAAQAIDQLGLAAGQSVLVVGANGGVGAHAVELAAERGLRVTGTGAAAAEDFVLSRGATAFLSREQNLEPGSFDGVIDTANLGTPALAAVRDDGAYVGLWPGSEPAVERGIRVSAVDVASDAALLADLARLADQGVLLARVAATYPLADAAEAHERLARGGLSGRIVLLP